MKNFRLLNNVVGWATFLVAAIVYILTIEPTASFWDCGEFISTSANLLVGHPPGAPFFMILGRFFSLFASEREQIAAMINIMSALASAFTILFLFWTITYFARKLVFNGKEPDSVQVWTVLTAGIIGALAYTFSDTFWFSAVEGEVYAMSSLFTAVVFWAILKWEENANEPHSNRWLILIAYLMGLSIGVHLLNLLAIPAIAMVYYFKKFEVNRANTIKAILVSGAILVGILYVIIPGVVKLATWFELLFVNEFGLPFNSGAVFYAFLLIGALVYGLWWTYKNNHLLLNTAITVVTVIILGYSSFAMIIIRSAADPTMDQNSPDEVFALQGYLNREQYGDRPLLYGQYYSSPGKVSDTKKGDPIRIKKNGKYEVVDYKPTYEYDSNTTTLFPRMYSSDPRHVDQYKSWANVKGKTVQARDREGGLVSVNIPTFGENILFFLKYQVYHMYFRYFMWNFSGRQNDIQGNGEVNKGNWITGFPAIDSWMYGDESLLPDEYTQNKARNKYFMLPLILGLVGLFFQLGRGREGLHGFWIVMLLFFLTGLAIVLYLNQTPLQPRERDYAYAGSFYAFSIWIGLGIPALVESVRRWMPGTSGVAVVGLTALLLVPGIMAAENWDDHDRSGRYIARDLAYNYLNTCDENAIIFTNGDNDTFPLWYIQEVEHIRTDVRVCNLSYLQTDWYIDQMKRKAYESDPMPFSLTHDQYQTGTRDAVYLYDRMNGEAADLRKAFSFLLSEDKSTKYLPGYSERIEYLPAKRFVLPVDSADVVSRGIVPDEMANRVAESIDINLNRSYIVKNDMMILDLLLTNNWTRPVYFAVTVGSDSYLNLQDYFQLEGFGYRLVPISTPSDNYMPGRVDTKRMYDNVMTKFRWTGFDDPKVYLDENHIRMATNIRNNMTRLVNALIDENQMDKAKEVLDFTMAKLPSSRVPHTYYSVSLAEGYYRVGNITEGDAILKEMSDNNLKELKYYTSLPSRYDNYAVDEINRNLAIYMEIGKMAKKHNRTELMQTMEDDYQASVKALQRFQ
ncbi:MAG: DUF2723 domain-containing protein [Marinilabiliaceae bacterium]|nr:DUF2723 domain-containing protein [Marinilabiliaceae bacterium]